MKDLLLAAAKKYIRAGLSVIATDEHKRALFPWKKFQDKIITAQEIGEQLEHPKAAGIAIICGAVSGGLEVVDIDLKYALDPQFFDKLSEAIKQQSEELYHSLLIIKTKSGGFHLYYRCELIEGNQKLAMRPATDTELKDNPQLKQVVLCETRGNSGYVVAPPSPGYQTIQGKSINVISLDHREMILEVCRSFNEVYEAPVINIKSRPDGKQFGLSPFDDYNSRGDVVELLIKHNWTVVRDTNEKVVFKRPGPTESKSSGDFNKRLNWFSVFTTNSCFQPNRAYLPYAVFAMLECEGDYKLAAKQLLDLGYGERRESYGAALEKEVFKKKQDGYSREDLIKFVVSKGKTDDEAEEMITKLFVRWGEKICTFWDIDRNGKILINRYRLQRFLCDTGGFHLYFYDPNSTIYRIVRVKDGLVQEASTEQIKKFIKEYVDSLPDTFDGETSPEELLEVIYKGSEAFFSKGFFEFLDRIDLDFLKDTKSKAFLPFKNGILVITGDKVDLKSYGSVDKVIWKSEVIDFDITVDQDFDSSLCEYYRFIEKICSEDETRQHYCLSLIGYLLHKYKDPARPHAVVLAEENENESAGGGTGKGIFVKALGYLLKTEKMDGKNFKLDKSFAFQRVGLDTKLVAIEDVRKNVDFEGFYSIITEGTTVEKKNKDELFIAYKDSPKIVFTTNYTLPSTATHAKRRQRVFEFSNFFSATYTPMDLFGHHLFDDWDSDEWNRFYNLMFSCIRQYLKEGIKEVVNSEKIKRKHIRLSFGEEFLEYWDDLVGDQNNNWKVFGDQYKSFLLRHDYDKKDYSKKRFKKALDDCSEIFQIKLETTRNWQNAGQHEFRIYRNGQAAGKIGAGTLDFEKKGKNQEAYN